MNKVVLVAVVLAFVAFVAFGAAQQPGGGSHPAAKAWQERRSLFDRMEYSLTGRKILHPTKPPQFADPSLRSELSTRREEVRLASSGKVAIESATGVYRLERSFEEYDSRTKARVSQQGIWTFDGRVRRGKQNASDNRPDATFTEVIENSDAMKIPHLIALLLPDVGIVNVRGDVSLDHNFIKAYRSFELVDLMAGDFAGEVRAGIVKYSATTKVPALAKTETVKIECDSQHNYLVNRISWHVGTDLVRETVYQYAHSQGASQLIRLRNQQFREPNAPATTEEYDITASRMSGEIETQLSPTPGSKAATIAYPGRDQPPGAPPTVARYFVTEQGDWIPVAQTPRGYPAWLLILLPVVVLLAAVLVVRQRRHLQERYQRR